MSELAQQLTSQHLTKSQLKKIKNNPLFVFNINHIMNNTDFRFVLKDPIANFYKLICYRLLKYCKNYFKDSNQNKRVK